MESKKRPRETADDGESGDDSRRLEPRRTSIPEAADDPFNPRLLMAPESFTPRGVMQEEFRNSSVNHASPAPRYRLQFQNDLPDKLYTVDKIMAKDKNKIQISIFDTTTQKIVTTGPLSSVKIKVLALHGDFCDDGKRTWTDQEFNKHIATEREGQGPLLRGKLKIQLENGVGYLDDITFSDNSSRTRSKNFSLAVRIDGIEVAQEGISRPFRVLDRRGKLYKKHHPPLLTDEVWRLEKIRKGGPYHTRLERAGIFNVEQFLRELVNEENLRSLLSGGKSTKKGIPNRTWDALVANAKECPSVAANRQDTIRSCIAPMEMVPPVNAASFPRSSAVEPGNLCFTDKLTRQTTPLHWTSTSGSDTTPSYQNELVVNTNEMDISSAPRLAIFPIVNDTQAVPHKINEHMYQNKPLDGGSGERLLEESEINDFITELLQPNISMLIVASSSRKWFKLIVGLKVWFHYRAVRRAESRGPLGIKRVGLEELE